MFAAVLVIKAFRQMYTAKTGYIRGDGSCIPVDSKPAVGLSIRLLLRRSFEPSKYA